MVKLYTGTFSQYVFDIYKTLKFTGEVEIDESLFGHKIKYNKGQPRGKRTWIFGLIERETNRVILYSVDNRKAGTLIPIIQKHVVEVTIIYYDSWGAYLALNELGYEHFTVIHKTTFKQSYKKVETGQTVDCHRNKIEGAWKICKDHFRRINVSNTRTISVEITYPIQSYLSNI